MSPGDIPDNILMSLQRGEHIKGVDFIVFGLPDTDKVVFATADEAHRREG